MKRSILIIGSLFLIVFATMGWINTNLESYYVPTTLNDFFMPGSQPLDSGTFDDPDQCDNCHGGYDNNAEPAFTWRGSMMAHAMRDPLFEASLVIANQDAIDGGDLCIRCHSPVGWLQGRSTPTDGTDLTAADREGVQCHFCHRMMDPLSTDANDLAYMSTLTDVPTVHGNGMFVVDDQDIRRGPYDNVQSNHNTLYSEFHTESEMCATCHDVSNPVFTKQPDGSYAPNTLDLEAASFDTYDMFPVERTYSEWKMSAYNTPTGIASTAFGGNEVNVISCQDCHMKDVTGKGADKNYAPIRSDLGQHDLTGGNTFVPELIKTLYPSEVDEAAIDDGILRSRYMLQNAATMNLHVVNSGNDYSLDVEIINETGHKLPSGYPEGRRMWIQVKAYDVLNNLIYESGSYDESTAELDLNNTKIYEAKLGMSQDVADIANANGPIGGYTAGESFHFALNNVIVKDNRIPPRGFTNANFETIQAAPVGYTYPDGAYFDITNYTLPQETYKIEVKLFYQTVSKEYIEFLRDNNVTNTKGQELYDLWASHGKSTPELMQEAEFFTNTLSLDEQNISELIKVYPNPSSDFITIDLGFNPSINLKIELFDLSGKIIKTIDSQEYDLDAGKIELITTDIADGTYILKLNIDNTKIVTERIIIK